MKSLFRAVGRVIFWTYSRGSWQYDILCGLILAFIFLTPKEFFVRPPFYSRDEPKKIEQKGSKAEKTGALEAHLRRRSASPVA
jgi:hypothetical protein